MTGKNTVRIGLTGGIASGKSTVADMFVEFGAVAIDTDDLSARTHVSLARSALSRVSRNDVSLGSHALPDVESVADVLAGYYWLVETGVPDDHHGSDPIAFRLLAGDTIRVNSGSRTP